jgi:hypothetical protein
VSAPTWSPPCSPCSLGIGVLLAIHDALDSWKAGIAGHYPPRGYLSAIVTVRQRDFAVRSGSTNSSAANYFPAGWGEGSPAGMGSFPVWLV